MHFWNFQNAIYWSAFLVFLNASRLVRSTIVFYLGGLAIGLSMSFLLFGYFLQRIIPISRVTKIPLFFGGWPLSLYIYYWIWNNFGIIIQQYRIYAVSYICTFTLLSLAICYRIGPPSDRRTLNLMEWLLQLLSFATIYLLSNNQQSALTAIFALVLFALWRRYPGRIQYFIVRTLNGCRNLIYGPEPRRLLSEEEYLEQSRAYTQMELEKLRELCKSQDSRRHWKLVSRLSKPNRMASFITGDSEHVSPEERTMHTNLYDEWEMDEDMDEDVEQDEEMSGYLTDDD